MSLRVSRDADIQAAGIACTAGRLGYYQTACVISGTWHVRCSSQQARAMLW
jgi:hypothetical protein